MDWSVALRQRRTALGLSQQGLAEASGALHQSDVSRLERGSLHPLALSLEKFLGLLRGLEWSLDVFTEATGLALPGPGAGALAAASGLEVSPDWLEFPVYGTVSAGEGGAEPTQERAFVPREKLRARGADPKDVRIYRVNGDCMISGEAQRSAKNIAPGDYVAVDARRKPQPGDIVVAFWPAEEKLVVKRYRIEGEDIVLYPASPAHPNLVLPREDDVFILGTVVWRGG
jgi:SOS-response transcriptional repressor LexA